MRVSRDEFEALVARAMEQLPPDFGELLDNVVVVVEDEPHPEDLDQFDDMEDGDDLLGIYRGLPLSQRDSGYCELPDQVALFRGPLTRYCRNRRELIREVRDTLVHELGHHFGLSDEEMPY